MKRSRLFSVLFSLILLVISVMSMAPAYAQEAEVTHDTIIAAIPDLINFEEQADQTFVGDVEGSYAYIAFVIQGNLTVIYVCDGYDSWGWFKAEVVNGEIHVPADEKTGIQIDATVTAEGVSGTVVLAIDDDGTPATAHAFTTVPAVPGKTGLARYVDENSVSGWIVTEYGIRGKTASSTCAYQKERYSVAKAMLALSTSQEDKRRQINIMTDAATAATTAGCGDITAT